MCSTIPILETAFGGPLVSLKVQRIRVASCKDLWLLSLWNYLNECRERTHFTPKMYP